jgi:hypothetical protein
MGLVDFRARIVDFVVRKVGTRARSIPRLRSLNVVASRRLRFAAALKRKDIPPEWALNRMNAWSILQGNVSHSLTLRSSLREQLGRTML